MPGVANHQYAKKRENDMVRTQSFALPSLNLNRGQLRDLLHIWIVFSMLLSTLSPLTTVGIGLPSVTSGGSTLISTWADLPAQLAPYLPGKASTRVRLDPLGLPVGSNPVDKTVSAPAAARPDVNTKGFSGWPVFTFEQPSMGVVELGKTSSLSVPGVGDVDRVLGDAQVGTALLPAWLIGDTLTEAVLGNSLLPSWLGGINGGIDGGIGLPGVTSDAPTLGAPTPAALPQAQGNRVALPGTLLWGSPKTESAARSGQTGLGGPALPLSPAAAACTPAANLDFALTIPPHSVSRGNVNAPVPGDLYTVTVKNNGTVSTTEVSILINPNAGFFFVAGSAAVSGGNAVGLTAPGSNTVPDASFTLALDGNDAQKALEPGETLVFTFRLATNAGAKSGQILVASLQSGSPASACGKSASQNVPTGWGNLVVQKTPKVQNAEMGDVITWIVELRNTGLGDVYNAVMTDTIGAGYTGLSITPVPGSQSYNLVPEASQAFTVTATVNSCTDLTNNVEGAWVTGNSDGTGTVANPVVDGVDVLYLLEDPAVTVQIGSLPAYDYCGTTSAVQVPVTVTNTGGPARNLKLALATSGASATLVPTPDWTTTGSTISFTHQVLKRNETVVFTLTVTVDSPICAGGTATISLTPSFSDACELLYKTGAAGQSTVSLGDTSPTLAVTKDSVGAPTFSTPNGTIAVYRPGETATFALNVAGTNGDNANLGGITITDTVPSILTNVAASGATAGSLVTVTGNFVNWTVADVSDINYSYDLTVTGKIPLQDVNGCGVGTQFVNVASAAAAVCPECVLTASDDQRFIVVDPLGPGNSFSVDTGDLELCEETDPQIITATMSVRYPVTWTNTIFTDSLGIGSGVGPFFVVSGTVSVEVNGVDRTASVISTTSPITGLLIDLSNIGTVSATADITISYQVTAGVNATAGTGTLYNGFTLGGYGPGAGPACDLGSTGFATNRVTIEDGALSVAVTPNQLTTCAVNNIVLTVSGADPDRLTDNIVITFTADASDIFTATSPTLGGSFFGKSVTVVQAGNVATFTVDATLDITGTGTISFPLYRKCGITTPLTVGMSYQNKCNTTKTASGQTSNSVFESTINLFVAGASRTLNERAADWRFYIMNSGNATASNIIITNTLPPGHTFATANISSDLAPAQASAVTSETGMVGGVQVVTFTVPALNQGARIRFDVFSNITSCTDPGYINIAAFQECGKGAGGVCQARLTGLVTLKLGAPSMVSSNNQSANLPLCEIGDVELVVKNSSAAVDLFDFKVRDYLTGTNIIPSSVLVTVYSTTQTAGGPVTAIKKSSNGTILENLPFTPTGLITTGYNQSVDWDFSAYGVGTLQREILQELDASDTLYIRFKVQTFCASEAAIVQSTLTSKDICDVPFKEEEDSKSLITDSPKLAVTKGVRNLTQGETGTKATTLAGVGDTLVWEMVATNSGVQRVTNLFIEDNLPAGFNITSITPVTSSQTGTGPILLKWHEAGGQYLGATGTTTNTATYLITGTVTAAACSVDASNVVTATYGCSLGDLCAGSAIAASAKLETKPSFAITPTNTTLDQCGLSPTSGSRLPSDSRLWQWRRSGPECGDFLHPACGLRL